MRIKLILSVLAALLALVGCGGGGIGGSLSGTFGALFISDSLDNHDHVWVTIRKVVLNGEGGPVTVFDDPAGMTIDLKTLRDGFGERYSFLASVPDGNYSDITFTMDKYVVLFETGSSVGLEREFAGNNGDTADLVLAFAPAKDISPNSSLVVDFDLGNWDDDGALITGNPFLQESSGDGLDDVDRHENNDIDGVVSGLSGAAPDQLFTLADGEQPVKVITNAQTVFCGFDALSNGMRVSVKGTFSRENHAFVARKISIDDENDMPEAEGPASEINAGEGTFVLTLHDCEHFLPTLDTVNVSTGEATEFFNRNGMPVNAEAFFASLEPGTKLEVRGPYYAESNTIAAIRVSYEDMEND